METTETTNFGIILSDTPIGRVLEFDEGREKAKASLPEKLVFQGYNNEGEIIFTTPDGKQWPVPVKGEYVSYEPDEWNSFLAEYCTGFVDPQGDETPEAIEQPEDAPEPEAEKPAVDKALAEVGEKLSPNGGWPKYDAEKLDAVRDALRARNEASENYETLHEQTKVAKKQLEVAQEALDDAVQVLTELPQSLPLFGQIKPDNPDDDWQSKPMMDIRKENGRRIIADKYLKALNENNPPITTMGELEAWRAKKGDYWAKDIKGLGEKGREQIEAACEAMLEQRQAKAAEAKPAAVNANELNASAILSKGACKGDCGWEELVERIDGLADDDRYEFAIETLNGIYNWVLEHEHCTPEQKQAVENIANSVHD